MAPGNVLIVEDETDLLQLFKTVLKRSRDPQTILTAAGGAEAIRILQTETPAVIVLDMAMPYISGNDVIQYIMSEPRLDKTLILVVSAVPMLLSEESMVRVAATLIKPVTTRDLEAAVNRLLQE